MTDKPRTTSLLVLHIIAVLKAWLLRRIEQDYEARGRLSKLTSMASWTLYLLHAGLTMSAARHPSRPLPVRRKPAVTLGGTCALLGSTLFGASALKFRSFEQVSGLEAGELMTSGPYRFSRNPQIVGWGLALLGASLAGRSGAALLLTATFFFVHRLHAPIEERHLERTFGEQYRRYRANVPRFLSLPTKS